jgi:multidrug efflux system membrane fusion protein
MIVNSLKDATDQHSTAAFAGPNGVSHSEATRRAARPEPAPPNKKGVGHHVKSVLLTGVTLLFLAAAGFAIWHWFLHPDKKDEKPQPKPIPVSAEKTKVGDLPVYLNGLGTVTATNTVTVRSRVDGQLINVAFTEGQIVKQDDLLVQIDPRPFQVQLEQAEGQFARDTASLNNAKADLARYEAAREAIPQQQIDTAAAAVAQFEGAIKVDQGQIDAAKLQITYCTITAPIGGRIGLRLVDVGNMVHASDANGLVVITQVQPITVQFTLPQDNLTAVFAALKKSSASEPPKAEAFNRDFSQHLATGGLLALDNQIDPTTGTFRLKAQFANEDNALFPNQFVNIRLLVDVQHDVVLAPAAALQRSPQGTIVYVVKDDQTVDVRQIKPGMSEGEWTVVREGLEEGEAVVTEGTDKLRAGVKVDEMATEDAKAAATPGASPGDASAPRAGGKRPKGGKGAGK